VLVAHHPNLEAHRVRAAQNHQEAPLLAVLSVPLLSAPQVHIPVVLRVRVSQKVRAAVKVPHPVNLRQNQVPHQAAVLNQQVQRVPAAPAPHRGQQGRAIPVAVRL